MGGGGVLFGFAVLGGRSVSAATWTVDEDNVTNAVPLVLSETLTIAGTGDGFVQTGAVSGTGDLHFSLPGKTASLLAPNTSAGDLYVDLGTLTVTNAAALGTGTVYVNEEETPETTKALRLGMGMSIDNPLVLGSEETARWAERIRYQNGTFQQNGKIMVRHSKLAAQTARVHVTGGIEGDKAVLAPFDASSTFIVEEVPPVLSECLWAGGSGTVRLAVADARVPSVYGFGTPTLVLEGTNFFPYGANFATQNSESHFTIDVNGHDQHFGSFAGEGANSRPCTLLNGKNDTCPTLTLEQTQDNLTTNLHFRGTFHLVKAGAACLTAGDAVKGNLEIRDGTYVLGREIPEPFAHAVEVGPGARLDLGGQTAFCKGTVTVEGGTVVNGTLRADRIVLRGAATVTARLVGGTVVKEGTEEMVIHGAALGMASTVSGQTLEVAEGVLKIAAANDCVATWTFASAETLFMDASGRGHDLVAGEGDGAMTSTDSPFGSESASGSLELDGKTWLTAAVFPDLPIGNVARTVACFVKPASDCAEEGAVLSWGNEGWASGRYMNFALRVCGGTGLCVRRYRRIGRSAGQHHAGGGVGGDVSVAGRRPDACGTERCGHRRGERHAQGGGCRVRTGGGPGRGRWHADFCGGWHGRPAAGEGGGLYALSALYRRTVRRRGESYDVAVYERAEGLQGRRGNTGRRRRGRRVRGRHGRGHSLRKPGEGDENEMDNRSGLSAGDGL